MTLRLALGVAYDGTEFHGFARQPQVATVGGTIAVALERVAGAPVEIVCAGRTDAGVHALAQVVHVDLEPAALERYGEPVVGAELPDLARSLSHQCGPAIEIWRALVAPQGFDARHSALSRRYRYELEVGRRSDPLRRNRVWHVDGPLDLAAMRIASDPLLGEHDFAGFCRRPPDRREGPLTRRVIEARWSAVGDDMLRFEIEAAAFCHQMVRSVVGALVAVGSGRMRPSDVVAQLRSGRRERAPQPAPAAGLTLIEVAYPPAFGGRWH